MSKNEIQSAVGGVEPVVLMRTWAKARGLGLNHYGLKSLRERAGFPVVKLSGRYFVQPSQADAALGLVRTGT